MAGEPCPCWNGPVVLHSNPEHCCFREDLVELPSGAVVCACGHIPEGWGDDSR